MECVVQGIIETQVSSWSNDKTSPYFSYFLIQSFRRYATCKRWSCYTTAFNETVFGNRLLKRS